MLHVFRHSVERDLFSIVFDWLALLDAHSSSLSVGIVFETWCRPRARPPLSLCIIPLFFLRFPRDQDNLYLPTSSFLFWDLRPLWCRPHQSKPAAQLTYTSLPAAGAIAIHQTGVCAIHAVLILRVCLCLTFTHTHVSTAVRVVSADDLGFYTSRRHRARAYVITGIHILCTA